MRIRFIEAPMLASLVIAMFSCSATAAHAGDQCIVYENKNFAGVTLALNMNQFLPALGASIDNKISSVRVRSGCILVAFADVSFKGQSQTWGRGDYPTLPKGWDDVISSVQCSCHPQ
jgi:hypothetical protein